jgi:hypothetical protein
MSKIGYYIFFKFEIDLVTDIIKILNDCNMFKIDEFVLDFLDQNSKRIGSWIEVLNYFEVNEKISLKHIDTQIELDICKLRSSLYFKLISNNQNDHNVFKLLLKNFDFINAFIYDYLDEFWQNADQLIYYELANIETKNLNLVKGILPGTEMVDISKNYGRMIWLGDIRFMCAPNIFLGQSFFNIIPKSVFLNFKNWEFIEDENYLTLILNRGIITLGNFRERQLELWNYLKIDELLVIERNNFRFQNIIELSKNDKSIIKFYESLSNPSSQ